MGREGCSGGQKERLGNLAYQPEGKRELNWLRTKVDSGREGTYCHDESRSSWQQPPLRSWLWVTLGEQR